MFCSFVSHQHHQVGIPLAGIRSRDSLEHFICLVWIC